MEKKIIFATGNENKMKEIRMILADLGMPILSMKEAGIDVDVVEDGTTFEIDRILDQRRAASLKAGGAGIRYTCVINGHQSYLFYEENFKWFVEAKMPPS